HDLTRTTMTSQTEDTTGEQIEVVSTVACPHQGAAKSLLTRAKQLRSTVYALKQHIYFLRNANRTQIESHQVSAQHLTSLDPMNPIPTVPVDLNGDITKGFKQEDNLLLAEDGLRILLQELIASDDSIADCFQASCDPNSAFSERISQLDDELEEIN